jgi:outer membrane biosynthesis protein TonB
MPVHALRPYQDRESTTTKWIVIFVLLSILAHVVLIGLIFLITHFLPVPKLKIPPPTIPPSVSLSLQPAPPPPKKQVFIPTKPQANVKPVPRPLISANDTNLQSKSKAPRDPNSIMPDVDGKEHNPNLNNSPKVDAPPKPEVAITPPTPRHDTPHPPTPPQPNPDKGKEKPSPTPQVKPQPPTPKPAPQQLVDEYGHPILPPLAAPTMAPPNSASPSLAPAPSIQEQATSVHGSLGRSGDNSPAAMASELGRYKQYIYSVVGSYWYPAVDQHFGLMPAGMVHIQFTIHSDGTISDVIILEGGKLDALRDISKNSLIAPAPFKPFNAALIKEVGDSYTDDFSFSVY